MTRLPYCLKGNFKGLLVAFLTLVFSSIFSAPVSAHAAELCRPHTLLIMPKPGVTREQVEEALSPYHAKIIRIISGGSLTTYVIDTCECGGTLDQMQAILGQLSVLQSVQKDYAIRVHGDMAINDPAFPSQYELKKIAAKKGWLNGAQGQGVTVAVLDTGCNRVPELSGKLMCGFNAYRYVLDGALLNGDTDTDPKPLGHGTAVATTLAAVTNNGTGTAAPAFLAKVYPVIISDPDGWGYDSTVIVGILKAQENGIRLINLSFQSFPPHTYADQADHPVLHAYLKQYHDDYNGLFFNGAGNSEFADPNPRTSNLIMISGTDKFDRLAFFTNTGSPLWFAAPAVLVQASDRNGQTQFVNGTSFAGPLACGVAAQILSKFPHLTNDQILDLMARTARREMNGYHPSLYGYGIPDAGRATKGKKLR